MLKKATLLPFVLAILLVPMTVMAQRPYTGKVITEYVGVMETEKGTFRGELQDHGSFVVVSPSHVLTNWHVVHDYVAAKAGGQEDAKLTLRFFNGQTLAGDVIASEVEPDLALVQFNGTVPEGVHRVAIAQTFTPVRITTGGYPMDTTNYEELTATRFEFLAGTPYFRFPGKIVVGQSGSPIVDQDGRLCGLLWGSDYPEQPLGYGTSVVHIRAFLAKEAPEILELKGN